MSTNPPSRDAFAKAIASRPLPVVDPAYGLPQTMADVLAGTLADTSLPANRRNDRASAIRSLAKVLGKPLEAIPAQPRLLRTLMDKVSYTAAGMSKERWRNIRSLVRTALADRGATTGSGCGEARVPLSPEWDALFQLLADRMSRFRLSRFIRFCSNQGISPEAVDDATFNRFRDTLDATDLKNSPRQVARTACQFWNKAADTIPGWPQHHVTVPNYTRFYAVPWSLFSTSLTAEIDAWLARLAGTDPLDELPFRPLRESSIATRRTQLHEYASALVHAGHPPDSLRSMADLVEVDRVKDALRFIINRKRELGVAVAGAAHLNAASVGGK